MQNPDTFDAHMKREREADRRAAFDFCAACHAKDIDAFRASIHQLTELSVSGWNVAIRKVARERPAISDEMKKVFEAFWIEARYFPLGVGDDRALATALRLLLPPYTGPVMRLYRGTKYHEWRFRRYGFSWSANLEEADFFAQGPRQALEGGTVVMETEAPAEAIIARISYPQEFSPEERAEFIRQQPRFSEESFQQFGHEGEYIVDRQFLGPVKVARRYSQIKPAWEQGQ